MRWNQRWGRLALRFQHQQQWRLWCLARMVAVVTLGVTVALAQQRGEDSDRLSAPVLFDRPIESIGRNATSDQHAVLLTAALQAGARHSTLETAELLEAFTQEHPTSPWTASLQANLGRYYFEEGSYTKALEQLERAWMATRLETGGPGKRVADYALAQWTRFLLALGRQEQLEVIFAETQGRTLDGGPLQQRFLRTREKFGIMRSQPAAAYRCGWMVMDHLVEKARGRGLKPRSDWTLYQENNLLHACSMNALVAMGLSEQWPVTGVQRPQDSQELPLPSIMHLKQGHFIALLGMDAGMVLAYDPVFGPRGFRPEVLNFEGSGRFLVPAGRTPAGWRSLNPAEMADTVGRCGGDVGSFGYFDCEETDCDSCYGCPPGLGGGNGSGSGSDGATVWNNGGGASDSSAATVWNGSASLGGGCGGSCGDGMPSWKVTEPNINLWLRDTPLRCQPAYGPALGFDLRFKQRDEYTGLYGDVFSLGSGWNCPWLSWVDNYYYARYHTMGAVELHMPGGGKMAYNLAGQPAYVNDYFYNGRFSAIYEAGAPVGFVWSLPDGRKFTYGKSWGNRYFYLTRYEDRNGQVVLFGYSEVAEPYVMLHLTSVADAATNTVFTLQYTNSTYPNLVSSVTDRFGRSAQLTYSDTSGSPRISEVQDAAGLVSTISYDANGWPDTLATPYGQTTFSYQWSDAESTYYRWIGITEPNGGKQHYAFRYNLANLWSGAAWMPTDMPASLVPGSLPMGTLLDTDGTMGGPSMYGSFYWNQQQSVGLSSTLTEITTNQMNKARIRHWLMNSAALLPPADFAVSFEIAPSQSTDGSTWGQITWYDYAEKLSSWNGIRGTNIEPSLIARKLPDGSTWYQAFARNDWGLPTTVTSTYGGYSPSTRSYTYTYAANGQDLTEIRYPGNTLVSSYTYDSAHRRTSEIQRPDANTSYTNRWIYDTYGRLMTNITSTGQTTLYTYNASSDGYSGYLSAVSGQPVAISRSYTWKDGNVLSFTDERGLCVTNFWDGLNRLTGQRYPDGTTTTNLYSRGIPYPNGTSAGPILDLTATRDRMNHWTYYDYDPLRRKVAETNALGVVTRYGYCDCGSYSSVTNAWGTPAQQVVSHTYDNQGNRVKTEYADGYSVTNWFNALRQKIATGDGAANRWFYYNNQGLLTNVSSAYGAEKLIFHDSWDRAQYVTDANGVTLTNTFDNLGRVLSRKSPDGGTDYFGYSAGGVIAYTNQIGQKTYYGYDALARKTAETNANNEIIRFTNNVAGDLLSLTDGKNQTTRWNYDEYGRVTNKLDQAGTVILRYKYDPDGRLTNRWSAAKGDTVYSYDAMDNLTGINYPNSTDVSFQYDWLRRLTNMVDAAGTTKYTYTTGNQPLTEDGPFANDTVTNAYSNRLRTNQSLQQPTGVWTNRFIYDLAARLTNVTSPAGAFGYLYKSASGSSPSLIARVSLPNTCYITNQFDPVGRLLITSLKNSGHTTLDEARYGYNTAHQRTAYTNAANVYYQYAYDNIGQLKVADSSVNTEDRGYYYDAAWNLNRRTNNGVAVTYTVDSKNQLTSDPGSASDIYDTNGNLTNRNTTVDYVYDDENRLSSFIQRTVARTDFIYDGMGRLRQRNEYSWTGAWNLASTVYYVYDGKRVIQERAANPTVSYTRGLDLSSTLEGAGGIGGLLARSSGYSAGNWTAHHCYHADGNGNITALVDSSQALSASYRYDPFGNTISSSGSQASANLYRFSSKEIHANSGMYYYLYRFYDPNLQRWLNRDPLRSAELRPDGPNLYTFVKNRPIRLLDPHGLASLSDPIPPADPSDSCQALNQAINNAAAAAIAAEEAGDFQGWTENMAIAAQLGKLYNDLGCGGGGPPNPSPNPVPVLCPVQGRRVPPSPFPPTNRNWCQNHPVLCGVAIGGLVITGVAVTCVLQPELCPVAIGIAAPAL